MNYQEEYTEAMEAFRGVAKAYKYNVAFSDEEHEFRCERTQAAWAAFWNGWQSRSDSESCLHKVRQFVQSELESWKQDQRTGSVDPKKFYIAQIIEDYQRLLGIIEGNV